MGGNGFEKWCEKDEKMCGKEFKNNAKKMQKCAVMDLKNDAK